MFFRCQECLVRFQNLGLKYWKLRARKLTLHLINVAEINAQQNERDLK